MKLLVVRYGRALGRDQAGQARGFLAGRRRSPASRGSSGSSEPTTTTRTSRRASICSRARSRPAPWGDGPMRPALSSRPAISDIEARYYDVDEQLSAVTRAPLGAGATA